MYILNYMVVTAHKDTRINLVCLFEMCTQASTKSSILHSWHFQWRSPYLYVIIKTCDFQMSPAKLTNNIT